MISFKKSYILFRCVQLFHNLFDIPFLIGIYVFKSSPITSNVAMNNRHMLLEVGASVSGINSYEAEFLGKRGYVFVIVLDVVKLSPDRFCSSFHSH